MKSSLRRRIIAWAFGPAAILLVAVALVSLYAYQKTTEKLVIERDRELTRLSARLLANDLAAYTSPLTGQFLTAFDGVVVFGADGTILAAEPPEYESWGARWVEEIARYQMFGPEGPVFSDLVTDQARGVKYVVIIMPTRAQATKSAGGIAGFFRLDTAADSALFRSIERLRRGDSQTLYLVDGKGRVIYHSTPRYIGQDFSGQPVVQLVLNRWAGAYRTHDTGGSEIVASFAPVPNTAWSLITEESWAELTASSRRFGQLLILLLALGVLIPTAIVTVGIRRIMRPIGELIRAAQEIASGNFDQRITASTGDEVEELAGQFNCMAAQLQESYAHLERKVADRTRELATLNAIAAEVSQSLDLDRILNNALDEVVGALDMDSGQAFRLEEESQTLISVTSRGLSESFGSSSARLSLNDSLAGEAASLGRPTFRLVPDYARGDVREMVEREGLQLVVSVPLMVHGRCVGAINLGSRTPRCITSEELSLLGGIGHQIGVAMENARLYEQAQQLAVMTERNRLARDLHDSVTQALYGVTLYAEAAARQLLAGDAELAVGHLCEIQQTAHESLREMRLLIFELRLPTIQHEGLAAALQARLEAVEARVGLETDFHAKTNGRLPPEVEDGLYRIAQEALNNALRHAQAHRVSVDLRHTGRTVTLEVADDGVGMDPASARVQGGFGLRGMEERAARLGGMLRVDSRPGQGTRISVEVYA